jgi:1-acyl-sn-glycerol-3-phosphate acyltransferase
MEAIIAFARQEKVWIFPEGHRSDSGRLQEGKEGTVLVARKAGSPLVPVAISGTEAGLLALLLRRRVLRIRMGAPFTLPAGQSRSQGVAEIMRRIEDLLPEERHRLVVQLESARRVTAGEQVSEAGSARASSPARP